MSKKHIFDKPENVKRVVVIFFSTCLVLFCIGLFSDSSEAHFGWEEWPMFYGVFGYISGVTLVMLAKHVLRPLVERDEDYYD